MAIPNDREPSEIVNYFAKLIFRIPLDSYATEGSLKTATLDIDEVESFSYGTRSASYPPASGTYHFDRKSRKFAYNGTFSSGVGIITCVAFVGTEGAYLSSSPNSESSDLYYYNPVIIEVPKKRVYLSDSTLGYTPVQTSNLRVATTDFKELKYFYKCSTLNTKLEVYQCVGEISPANIKKVFTGLCGNFKISSNMLNVDINDQYSILQQSFSAILFYSGAQQVTAPYIFGEVRGVRASLFFLNLPDNPSIHLPTYRIGYFKTNTPGAGLAPWLWIGIGNSYMGETFPAATTTSIILNKSMVDARRIAVGDRIILSSSYSTLPITSHDVPAGTIRYAEITAISSYSTNFYLITHTNTGTIAANQPWVWTGQITRGVNIVMQNYVFKAYPHRDYSEFIPSFKASAEISFNNGYATNLGLPAFLSTNDLVYVTRGVGNGIDNPVELIKHLLTDHLGVNTSDIDETVFSSIAALYTSHKVAMCVPDAIGASTPTYQDVFSTLLQSCLLRLFQNADGKWTLSQVAPMGVESGVDLYDDTNTLRSSSSSEFNFDDIVTDVVVTYDHREVAENPLYGSVGYQEVRENSTYAQSLHGVSRLKEVKSYFISQASAQQLAKRLLYIWGDRTCRTKISAPLNFEGMDIGMKCRTKKTWGRNIQYTDVNQESTGVVVSVDRGERKVEVIVDDQFGIERNKGSWNA